jgi:hypothetical protein
MAHHDLSRSTHTPELYQLRELNERLAAASQAGTPVTAEALGLTGQPVEGPGASAAPEGVPGSALLDHLSAEGPPDFPYIAAMFRGVAAPGAVGPLLEVAIHTATLRRLSQTFHLHHIWGA